MAYPVNRVYKSKTKFISEQSNKPYLDWAFCQPKKTWRGGGGGGAKWPSPNLASSSQMTMKRGKDILWVEIFKKLTKMCDDVIVMLIL